MAQKNIRLISRTLAASALFATSCAPIDIDDPGVHEDELSFLGAVRDDTAVADGLMMGGRQLRPVPGMRIGCDGTRVVGYRSNASNTTCPAPVSGSRWRGRLLFDPSVTTNPDRRGTILGAEGGAFCVYEYDNSDGSAPSLDGLPSDTWYDSTGARFALLNSRDRAPSSWLQADCRAIVPLGEIDATEHAAIVRTHHEAWRRQIDRVPTLPIFEASGDAPYAGPFGVEVALLDTSPDETGFARLPPLGTNPHGRTMGRLIDDILCPQGTSARNSGCAQLMRSYQVVGEGDEHMDRAGFITQLAERIVEATRRRVGSHLIINLSVGSHPRYMIQDPGSDDVVNFRIATYALMAALNYASCEGALTIAASGNDEAGGARPREFWEQGALFPAALATMPGWTCDRARTSRNVPLVYAASGLTWDDRDLPNQRAGSRARLAGPAFSTTIEDDEIQSGERLYTGTSVAAADVSAVAGLVWAYLPNLSAPEVVRLVESAAVPLDRSSALCGGAAPCAVTRRVSACRTLRAVLARLARGTARRDVAKALADLECNTPAAGSSPPAQLSSDFFSGLDALTSPIALTPITPPSVCNYGSMLADSSASFATQESYCPDAFFGNGIDFVTLGPQPPEDPCRYCVLKVDSAGNGVLYAQLDPVWQTTLRSPVLNVYHPTTRSTSYGLGTTIQSALTGELVTVRVSASQLGGFVDQAALVFQRPDQKATVTWLPIYRP
jgi:hypothetical protein